METRHRLKALGTALAVVETSSIPTFLSKIAVKCLPKWACDAEVVCDSSQELAGINSIRCSWKVNEGGMNFTFWDSFYSIMLTLNNGDQSRYCKPILNKAMLWQFYRMSDLRDKNGLKQTFECSANNNDFIIFLRSESWGKVRRLLQDNNQSLLFWWLWHHILFMCENMQTEMGKFLSIF